MPTKDNSSKLTYAEFLSRKKPKSEIHGFEIDQLPEFLFNYQEPIVRQALRIGRYAIFADTGLGKTAMQLTWADCVVGHTDKPVLIVAPLAVSGQTQREAEKFGIDAEILEANPLGNPGIYITNYEKLHRWYPEWFAGVVLDESSILKGMMGKVRKQITDFCSGHNYLLSCTATPSPNDFMEIGTQSEFLRHMNQQQMLSMFFTHDSARTSKWRLKHHGKERFYDWMTTWCCAIRKPSDLGFSDDSHELNPLSIEPVMVGELDPMLDQESMGMLQRNGIRKESLQERCDKAADIANGLIASGQNVLVWCNLNAESDLLKKTIIQSVDVKGSDKPDYKSQSLNDFALGKLPCLISKPSIAGFGMNFQHHCSHVIFVGLSDSWERFYQGLRRVWRYGQLNDVFAYVISHANEGPVVRNIERKTEDNTTLMDELCSRSLRLVK